MAPHGAPHLSTPLRTHGLSSCRDKPYVFYFNILDCAVSANVISIAQKGLQCPTPQVRSQALYEPHLHPRPWVPAP